MNESVTDQQGPPRSSAAVFIGAAGVFAVVLLLFWFVAKRYAMESRVGGHMPSAFATFALLLAPYWFFAFGLAGPLDRILTGRAARSLAPCVLVVPYLVFTLPRGEFRLLFAVLFAVGPVLLAGVFAYFPPRDDGFTWQDALALIAVGIPIEFGVLRGAFPHPGLGVLPKFLLMDALLYVYLVVRRLPRIGYDLRLRSRDVVIGLREFAFFTPIAIVLGLAISFIRFRPYLPEVGTAASAWLITFFFVALPEEFFFRGLLQNLLESRWKSSPRALLVTSLIFGLSHFNKPLPFNWRYVTLASIAGVFYGQAWLDRRRLSSSAITHATVDVVWGLWFRLRP